MKFLLVIASIIVMSNALDQEFKEKIIQKMQEHGAKCMEEVHATEDDIAELLAHKVPPTSHEAKCLILCMHTSFKVMSEDGTPNKEGALKMFEPLKAADADLYEKSLKIFDACADLEKDSDPCVAATNFAVCGIKEGKALGISEDLFEM